VATIPLAKQLNGLGTQAVPSATELDTLTASLDKTGAIQQLMAVLFNGTNAANGFDNLGHYVRDELLVSDCTGYAINPVPGCSAKFSKGSSASADATAAAAAVSPATRAVLTGALSSAGASVTRATAAPLSSLLDYLIGPGG
jgi:phospholipid/cholesterol/gamma-HCH transport system substrate-binding protein